MKNKTFMIALFLIYIYSLIHLNPSMGRLFVFALQIGFIMLLVQIFLQYKTLNSRALCKNYLLLLMLITAWMLFITLFNSTFGVGKYSISRIIQDFISMTVLASGFILTTSKNIESQIKKYIKVITTIALISGFVALYYADFSAGRAVNVWRPQYIWWGLLFPWSYVLIYISVVENRSKKWRAIAYIITSLYFVLGVLFGKRIVFYELLVIIITILIAKKDRSMLFKLLKLARIFVVLVIVYFISSLFIPDTNIITNVQQTISRFTDLSISSFDRMDEFLNVFNEYPITFIITGSGLGSWHSGPGGINLHIGWLNYLYKGGLLFLILELWVFKLAIQTLFKSYNKMQLFLAASVVSGYGFILISSAWVASPQTISFSVMKFALLCYIDKDYKSNKNKKSWIEG